MNFRGVSYLAPEYVWLIPVCVLLVLFFVYQFYQRNQTLSQIAPFTLLKNYLIPRSHLSVWLKGFCVIVAWITAVIAFMGPQGHAHYPKGAQEGGVLQVAQRLAPQEVIFLIDASASMSVKDTRTGESRLGMAKDLSDTIVQNLGGNTLTLYAFTSAATRETPPTLDSMFVRLMLQEIQINEGGIPGTDFVKTLETVKKERFSSHEEVSKIIVIFSDGGDTKWDVSQGDEKKNRLQDILNQIPVQPQGKLHIFTIGIGSTAGQDVPNVKYQGHTVHSNLDTEVLQKLAEKGHGMFYDSNQYSPLALSQDLVQKIHSLTTTLSSSELENTQPSEYVLYDLFFQIPLAIAILCLLIAIFFPATATKMIPCILFVFFAEVKADVSPNIWAEAGDTAYAIKQYEDQLANVQDNWDRWVLLYNIGTSYMQAGEYEKAIPEYAVLSTEENVPPFLRKWVKINMAIAELQLGVKEKNKERAIYLFHTGLNHIREAEIANCSQQKLEGAKACTPSKFFSKLTAFAKIQLNTIYNTIQEEGGTLQDNLYYILGGLQFTNSYLSQLMSKDMPPLRQKEYLQFYINGEDAQKNWWQKVNDQLQGSPHLSTFLKAKKNYEDAIFLISKMQFVEAATQLKNANGIIQTLTLTLKEGGGLEKLGLEDLRNGYLLTISSFPNAEMALKTLQSQQENFLSHINKNSELQALSSILSLAIESFNQGKQSYAHFFLTAAVVKIDHAIRNLDEKTPILLLKWLIDEQLAVLQLQSEARENEVRDETVETLLKEAQQNIIQIASTFIPNVYKWQMMHYTETECFCTPWDQLFPLFEKGRNAAFLALEELKKERYYESMQNQQVARQEWKEALRLLENPPPPTPQNKPPIENPANLTTSQSLQLLQQMQQMDETPQSKQSVIIEGGRDW